MARKVPKDISDEHEVAGDTQALIKQAIDDINLIVANAINRNTNLLDSNEQKKLMQRIDLIAQDERLYSQVGNGAKALSDAARNAKARINQIKENQSILLNEARHTIDNAIKEINSIAQQAAKVDLISESNEKKSLTQQINSVINKKEVKKAVTVLGWEWTKELTRVKHEAIAYIQLQENKQKERAQQNQQIIDEARQVLTEAFHQINSITDRAYLIEPLDIEKANDLIQEIKNVEHSESIEDALLLLDDEYTKKLSYIVRNAITQIQEEVIRQEKDLIEASQTQAISEISVEPATRCFAKIIGQRKNKDYGDLLEKKLRMDNKKMITLKQIVDETLGQSNSKKHEYSMNANPIENLQISQDNVKLKEIPVIVERLPEGRILVKVGPCDLSGVGGHLVREQIIKDLVTRALKESKVNKSYEEINVSACVAVRGRLQMFLSFFVDNREKTAEHANAYIKTENEPRLTLWEPRKGPQSFFNDTICAVVISVITCIFEKNIRKNKVHSSAEATKQILESPSLKKIFENLLNTKKDRLKRLISDIREKFTTPSDNLAHSRNMTSRFKNETKPETEDPDSSSKNSYNK